MISIHSLRVEGDIAKDGLGVSAVISIHSLRVEGDPHKVADRLEPFISIHSLRVEGDGTVCTRLHGELISIHSLRVEGDRCHDHACGEATNFNPLPPCGGRQLADHDMIYR